MLQSVIFTRRKFLKGSSGVLAGTLMAGSGAVALLAPGAAWSLALTTLNDQQAAALLKVARHIFPHATLDDAVYALVVKDLDAAAADETIYQQIVDGLAALDTEVDGNWLQASAEQQLAALTKHRADALFGKVQGTAVVSLYNNDMAWAHFGYEGSSFEEGGYFNRGFQDLDWLPAPPDSASPPKA